MHSDICTLWRQVCEVRRGRGPRLARVPRDGRHLLRGTVPHQLELVEVTWAMSACAFVISVMTERMREKEAAAAESVALAKISQGGRNSTGFLGISGKCNEAGLRLDDLVFYVW